MRTKVMGILNVTSDSFAESTPLVTGDVVDLDAAVARGMALADAGADIIDVGGESTRPGAQRVPEDEELARVLPVVRALAAAGLHVSIDTTRAAVAGACVDAGAAIINDVSGGTADPGMLSVMADSGVQVVLMHRRGESSDMYAQAVYADPLAEVCAELARAVDAAVAAGVSTERIVIDPGLGFAKTPEHNWALLRALPTLVSLGLPVLIGASRKRFLGELLAGADGSPRAEGGRDHATAAVSALCAAAGVWAVRVHEVASTADALAVGAAMRPIGDDAVHTTALMTHGATIRLSGIEAFGRHGVFDFEREHGQQFTVDAQLWLPHAPQADSLHETIDYSAVAAHIERLIAGEPVNLIETLAESVAAELLSTYPCSRVAVTVHKPHAPMAAVFGDVSVTVERSR